MVLDGLRGRDGNPASPPYRNGPYTWNQYVDFTAGIGAINTPGQVYYVDRNSGGGDGSSWGDAFLTITEAITAVNADYTGSLAPGGGRNRYIFIGEGYYAEEPVTLSASDVTIVCIAPGTHDSTVFWGNGTAGSFTPSDTGAPAITITGDNNTIVGLGIVNRSSGLFQAVLIADGALANKFVGCKITKDAADSCTYGFEDLGNAFTEWHDCEFTVSCKTAGIRLYSATNNGIQQRVNNCRFIGGPTGVLIDAASHQAEISYCRFVDDTSDTAETMDTPILNNGGVKISVLECIAETSTADQVTGSGTSLQANLQTYTAE